MENLTTKKFDEYIKEFNADIKNGISHKEAINRVLIKVSRNIEKKAVLGFDIYRYSQYNTVEQAVIPMFIKQMLNGVLKQCYEYEAFIFQKLPEENLRKRFIDTGDGGFLIFDNPLQAIVFAIYFQASLKRYNSGHIFTKQYYNIVGPITLRYCLTFDEVYHLDHNFYGSGIINNARILAKDRLNRFLVDNNCINWFDKELNGLENILSLELIKHYRTIKLFETYYPYSTKDRRDSLLFDPRAALFLATDILHIGEILSKNTKLNIYSIHVQVKLISAQTTELDNNFDQYTVSLGNLNSSDIS